ncbi:major capsid protein [Paracidovorax citrulli]
MFAKTLGVARKFGSRAASAGAVLALSAASAHAALPEGVQKAIDDFKADASTAVVAMMGAGVVIWGLLALKRKMGW